MTNESSIMTLDIGGDSGDAVSASEALAGALERLNEAADHASATLAGISAPAEQTRQSVQGAGEGSRTAGEDAQGAATSFGEFGSSLANMSTSALGSIGVLEPLASAAELVKEGFASAAEQVAKAGGDSEDASDSLNDVEKSATGAGNAAGGAATNFANMGAQASGVAQTLVLIGGAAGLAAVGVITSLGEAGAEWGASLERTSALTGLSIEEANRWSLALQDVGGSEDSLNRVSMIFSNNLEKAREELESGSKTLSTATKDMLALGVITKGGSDAQYEFGTALEKGVTQLSKIDDAATRASASKALFGKGSADLILLEDNLSQIESEVSDQTEISGDSAIDAAKKALEYHKELTDLSAQMHVIEVAAIPGLVGGLGRLGQFVASQIDTWNKFSSAVDHAAARIESFLGISKKSTDQEAGPNMVGVTINGQTIYYPKGSDLLAEMQAKAAVPGASDYHAPGDSGADSTALDDYRKRLAELDAELKNGKDAAAAARAAAAAARKLNSEEMAYENDILKALKDGHVGLVDAVTLETDAIKQHLTPAQQELVTQRAIEANGAAATAAAITSAMSDTNIANVARLDLEKLLRDHTLQLADAQYQAKVQADELTDAVKAGGDAMKVYVDDLAQAALTMEQSALGNVLGAPTRELLVDKEQAAEIDARIANAKVGGATSDMLAPLEQLKSHITDEIAVETTRTALLAAKGALENQAVLNDQQQNSAAQEMIRNIRLSSSVLSDHSLTLIKGFGGAEQAATTLANALLAASRAVGQIVPPVFAGSGGLLPGSGSSLALAQRGG